MTEPLPRLTFGRLLQHPTQPNILAWTAGKFLFILDVAEGLWIARRLEVHDREIRSLEVNGTTWVTAGDDKKVCVLSFDESAVKVVAQFPKKIMAAVFSENKIIIGDKFGDVFRMEIDDLVDCDLEHPLVGHMSQLTHLHVTEDQKYLVTADRDETIRISRHPQVEETVSFCLGHSSFIVDVCRVGVDLMCSVSGDRTLRLWRMHTGEEISQLQLPETPVKICKMILSETEVMAIVQFDQSVKIMEFKIDLSSGTVDLVGTRDLSDVPLSILICRNQNFAAVPILFWVDLDGRLREPVDWTSGRVCEGLEADWIGMQTGDPIKTEGMVLDKPAILPPEELEVRRAKRTRVPRKK